MIDLLEPLYSLAIVNATTSVAKRDDQRRLKSSHCIALFAILSNDLRKTEIFESISIEVSSTWLHEQRGGCPLSPDILIREELTGGRNPARFSDHSIWRKKCCFSLICICSCCSERGDKNKQNRERDDLG